MIEPTSKDIGRFVLYMDGAPVPTVESGRVNSFNETTVFVAFPQRGGSGVNVMGCNRDMLWWLDKVAPLLRRMPPGWEANV